MIFAEDDDVGQTVETIVTNTAQEIVRRRSHHHFAAKQALKTLVLAKLFQILDTQRNRHEIENGRTAVQTPVALLGRREGIEVLQQTQAVREIRQNGCTRELVTAASVSSSFTDIARCRIIIITSLVKPMLFLHSIYPKWRQQDPYNEVFFIRRTGMGCAGLA
ncbi:MAG: hypothetical protein KJ052_08170 [Candidatus Hydrogenedentes bacterium]|nr:hypothetical protein [Candidatus Hydrogenedentota bacterium]